MSYVAPNKSLCEKLYFRRNIFELKMQASQLHPNCNVCKICLKKSIPRLFYFRFNTISTPVYLRLFKEKWLKMEPFRVKKDVFPKSNLEEEITKTEPKIKFIFLY